MPKPPRLYTRLTRRVPSVASYNSLWLGADHLLLVHSMGVTEEYRRVQLRDIKGLFVIGSDRRLYWSLPWGVIAAISGIVLGNDLYNGDFPGPFSIGFFAVAVIALGWNYLLGPGCRVFVVTGVQTAPLPSVVRRRKADKILARLAPLITAAQADLPVPAPVAPTVPAADPASSPAADPAAPAPSA
jgi:hypothetical protein